MICNQCGTVYETAKFCVKCGVPLVEAAEAQFEHNQVQHQTSQEQEPIHATQVGYSEREELLKQPMQGDEQGVPALPSMSKGWDQVKQSQVMQQSAQISKQYGKYYLRALMYPFVTIKDVNKSHFTNGLVTMVLTALLIPLSIYILLSQNAFIDIPFGKTVIKPFLLILIALLASGLVCFGMIRLARVGSDFMTVTAKLGTMLVPASAAFFLFMICVVLEFGTKVPMFFLSVGLTIIIVAIAAVVLSVRKESASGLDPLYGAVIAIVVFGYILVKFVKLNIDYLF